MYYGVPLLLIPQQFEQLLNARCVEAQGAGLIIGKAYLGEAVTAADLRPALPKLFGESGFREAAARVQQDLRATGGFVQAADEIQRYMDRKRANSDA
jgi:UDP:flavonoid glycosyltransferase YjiC (YdhE family)